MANFLIITLFIKTNKNVIRRMISLRLIVFLLSDDKHSLLVNELMYSEFSFPDRAQSTPLYRAESLGTAGQCLQ